MAYSEFAAPLHTRGSYVFSSAPVLDSICRFHNKFAAFNIRAWKPVSWSSMMYVTDTHRTHTYMLAVYYAIAEGVLAAATPPQVQLFNSKLLGVYQRIYLLFFVTLRSFCISHVFGSAVFACTLLCACVDLDLAEFCMQIDQTHTNTHFLPLSTSCFGR